MALDATGAPSIGTGTSVSVAEPAGGVSGKLVLLMGYLHNNADAQGSFTLPSGFSFLFDLSTSSSTRGRLIVLLGVNPVAGPFSISWSTSSTYDWVAQSYSNFFTGAGGPIDNSATAQATGNTTLSIAPPAFSLLTECDLVQVGTNHATNAGNWTQNASIPEKYDNFTLSGGVAHLYVGESDSRAAGAVGVSTLNLSGNTGNSLPKAVTFGVRLVAIPIAPTVSGNADQTTADISWTYPSHNDTMTSQEVRINGGTPIGLSAGATSYHATGLSNETAYTFEVRGINAQGTGPWSRTKTVLTGSTVAGVTRRYFTSTDPSGWQVPTGVTSCKVLVVAGGGSGGGQSNSGGGGGAGGVDEDLAYALTPGAIVPFEVGTGALGVPIGGPGLSGERSVFGTIICDGGGYGGAGPGNGTQPGGSGGSGGGGPGSSTGSAPGGAATGVGTGNAGGNGYITTTNGGNRAGGGGGGAGGAGTAGAGNNGGDGGLGLDCSANFGTLFGVAGVVAGGGGGGKNQTGGSLGLGTTGGGGDGTNGVLAATSGVDTSGAGGGGGNQTLFVGGDGGDGVIVLIYNEPSTDQLAYWGVLAS